SGLPVTEAVRRAVLAANHYRAADVPELRARMSLIGSVPALMANAAVHYDAWERAVSDFVARRTGQPPDSLYPLAVGRATLAACRPPSAGWGVYAAPALRVSRVPPPRALAAGFAEAAPPEEPRGAGHTVAAARNRQDPLPPR